jgi:2-polyprenyl-3-methyl-5-hydroxy-6-metoxy-1,4-benzoquinol methylase
MNTATADGQLLQTSLSMTLLEKPWNEWFRSRQRAPEVMDQPTLAKDAHHEALRGLSRTNCWGTTRRQIWKAIVRIARQRKLKTLRVLDVACGAGDLAIWLKRRSVRAGLHLLIEGCDKSSTAVDFAKLQAAIAGFPAIRFFKCDILSEHLSSSYDIVTCSLFLHHLDEFEAVSLLKRLAAVTNHALLVDDLRRSVSGYGLAWLGCAILTRSPVVHVDAPLSVRAAFRENEAQHLFVKAGLQGATLRRHWPQRYLITWEQPWTASKTAAA